jgi:D-3-phosphoglycerate dehydrogenase
MNTPFGNSITTAEHAIALMFALARQLPEADKSTQAGKWEKNRFMGVEITKTLGLIGAGNIGDRRRPRDRPAMKVVAYRPLPVAERAIEWASRRSSSTSCSPRRLHHAAHPDDRQDPQHPRRENLAKTKKGVRIINCARGGLIDEAALAALDQVGHVAGAGTSTCS